MTLPRYDFPFPMIAELKAEVAQLTEQTEDLKKQVYRLDLEKSVLEKAAEVLKKGRGISIQTLTNREKAVVINALMSERNHRGRSLTDRCSLW